MAELTRRLSGFAAFLLCASMLMGVVVLTPEHVEAQGPEGWIVGQVTDESSNPVQAYIIVMMTMSGGSPSGGFWTDENGNFNITVYGGLEFMILAANASHYVIYTSVTSIVDEEVRADLTMVEIAPVVTDVTIRGFVRDIDGNPAPGGNIIAYVKDPANMGEGAPLYANMTQPDLTGEFMVKVIPGPVGGGVGAFDYVGYSSSENQTDDPLVSGNTYWLNITLEPEVSTDDARVSGHVYDASTGLPIEDAAVQFRSRNAWNEGSIEYSNITFTDASGFYEMNVTNGTADIWISKAGYSMNMVENMDVQPLDDLVVDAWLAPLTATVIGNVTDGKTGLGIEFARVFVFGPDDNVSMAITNSTGDYVLDTFDGADLYLGAEAESYSRSMVTVDISPGDTLYQNFTLWPVDAWMNGTVVDKYSREPLAGANLEMSSPIFNEWENSDPAGEYNFTELVSGDYNLRVWAGGGYRDYEEPVTVVPGANTWVVEMVPWDIPETCKLFGWVNDSVSGNPIPGAQVEVAEVSDGGEQNQTLADGAGYFEMWIPPLEMTWLATAEDHEHASGTVDAQNFTAIELDVDLVPDTWNPNVTRYDHAPTENISTLNPSVLDIEFDEDDVQSIMVFFFKYWYNDGMLDYYYGVRMLYTSFNPIGQQASDLPYTVVGDHYTIHYEWAADTTGGWLWNATDDLYLPCWQLTVGPDTYNALRGQYMNESSGIWETGTMFFDAATGAAVMFQFDYGVQDMLSDPTGMFAPEGQVIQKDPMGPGYNWFGNQHVGEWSVVGLQFAYEPVVPSGKYFSVFGVGDWGGHGMGESRELTVDTDPPVAEAGADQNKMAGEFVYFDASGSSDNVGIVNWTWTFTAGGIDYVLYGENVSFIFNVEEDVVVTLTVRDAGNNTATDTMVVHLSGWIPEFPSLVIPVLLVAAVVVVMWRRKR